MHSTSDNELLISFILCILQNDVDLIHEIEAFTGKKLDKFECKEKEVLEDNITRVSVSDFSRIMHDKTCANFI